MSYLALLMSLEGISYLLNDGESSPFSIDRLTALFRQCREMEEGIHLSTYLLAYEELNKFFAILGSIFSFVTSDICSKMKILCDCVHSENAVHYYSVKTMLDYEKGVGMLEDANNCVNNGSRTLLRLHRALLFVVRFIESVRQSTSDNIITLAKAAYDCTLANYHSWIIRRAVHLALYTLPTRRELLRHILGNDDANNAEQCLDALMLECNTVYDAVEKLYGERKLLQLP
ncbi:Ceramide-1-phosphate transfer protein [Trichinella pseudospiralis]|uniref:Ceramide-1-phosphate transfer protein n=2 Tax=Trichinella pseudospiralis TaxID=6337 RepID=A0A0V0XRB4_TRIPS|nr:Ceramide-1-phosphate transfer protein [Trichinella pseudospiralis]KRX90446.1 Ceramide-1-phosphate transfer protein [Trichinella pseudospiralis]KRY66917.1 Ceramide-1-phosphate transfer protein [Trichinella pseudospiralis]KRY66918.1 Ceramide-1-phosphate transfer protein [Trichinella pseudospiralis]KRY66919.1 Ceramide-1-phosphate transfer protein [Trichinella pseudospiralis]